MILGAAITVLVWVASAPLADVPVARAVATAAAGIVLLLVALRVTRTGLTAGDLDAVLRAAPRGLVRVAGRLLRLVAQRRTDEQPAV